MENIVLYGPGGASPVNLGSWLQADPGPDYGARGLIQPVESESFTDGGCFIYERAGIRKMAFPLLPASGGAGGLSLTQLESLIRKNARPGGYIDVQPDGVASAEAVRFDLVHGRWEPVHSIYVNRAGRRPGTLYLDTQPYGYWPTTILLASAAPTGPFGQIVWNRASVIGDAPVLYELNIVASVASVLQADGVVDGVFWSIGRATNMPSAFVAASAISLATSAAGLAPGSYIGTVASDGIAPFGALLRGCLPSHFWGTWINVAQWHWQPASGYYAPPGRYRAFGYVRVTPSHALPWQFSLDESPPLSANFRPLASAYPVATAIPLGNASYPDTNSGSGPFQILDLGEHTIIPYPSVPTSGGDGAVVRLWARAGSTNIGLASYANVEIAGIYLLPVDGGAGVLPYGLAQPSYGGYFSGGFYHRGLKVDAINKTVYMAEANSNDGAATLYEVMAPAYDAGAYHYGVLPQGGSQFALNFGILGRRTTHQGATSFPQHNLQPQLGASVRYRPRFQFLRGL